MYQIISFNQNRVYPMLVVATMSSGKSTLVNALIGKELLPNQNGACTSKTVGVLDNDLMTDFTLRIVNKDGKKEFVSPVTLENMKELNASEDISELLIEGQVRGIKNSKKSLMILDTPGINNCMDKEHTHITVHTLKEHTEGLILYVLNASQLGTYDDRDFLRTIKKLMDKKPKFNILFAVNKIDMIDPEKEDLYKVIYDCKKYIEDIGFHDPFVIPVAARDALLIKSVLNGETITQKEERKLLSGIDMSGAREDDYQRYAYIPEWGELDEKITFSTGKEISRGYLRMMLNNTGIPLLETVIDETMVRSLKMRAPKVVFRRASAEKKQKKVNK